MNFLSLWIRVGMEDLKENYGLPPSSLSPSEVLALLSLS